MRKDVFDAIGNPVRRKILLLLDKKAMSYKELTSELNISIGSLYYHLNYLRPFLIQDQERKFMLNEEGRALVRDLITGRVGEQMPTKINKLIDIITLHPILVITRFNLFFSIILGGLLLLIEYSMLDSTRTSIFLTMPYINIETPVLIPLYYGITLLIIALTVIVLSVFYGRNVGYINLLLHIPLAIFPITLYAYISIFTFWPYGLKEILYYPFTLWFIGLLARILKDISGVNYIYSLVFGLILSYISLISIFF